MTRLLTRTALRQILVVDLELTAKTAPCRRRQLDVITYFELAAERTTKHEATRKYAKQHTIPQLPVLRFLKLSSRHQADKSKFEAMQTDSTNIFHKYKKIMDAPSDVFQGCVDRFNGVTVDSKDEYVPMEEFASKLEKSLAHWKADGKRAIWFKIRTSHADWVPHLAQNGFDYHHAMSGFVLMNYWLPTEEQANIPAFAHTMVGVGGLVVNMASREVLVITDRFAIIPNSWKLPGGYVEPGENLVDAAIREVREETGIDTCFETIVSIRHSHGGSFNCSDVYVVVALQPKNLDFKRCEREIARIRWMPIDEYLQHPNVHETNRHFMRTFLDYQRRGIQFTSEEATHSVLKKRYQLYYMKSLNMNESNG